MKNNESEIVGRLNDQVQLCVAQNENPARGAAGAGRLDYAAIAKTLQALDLKFEQSAHSLVQSLGALSANHLINQKDVSRGG